MIGLNVAQRRWSAPVADDRAFPVGLPVAEPLQQDLLAGYLIQPHPGLDVFDVPLPNQQPFAISMVAYRVRHRRRFLGNRARCRNARPPRRWQPRRLSRAAVLRIGHSLAEGMEPNDRTPEGDRVGKGVSVTCD